MSNSKVTYYNNSTGEGFDAQLSISTNQLRISYRDNVSQQTVYWNIEDVERADVFSDTNIVITKKGKPVQSLVLSSSDILKEIKFHNQSLPFVVKYHNKKASG